MAQQREARVKSDAAAPLTLRRLHGREEVSRPFRYGLTLLSPSHDLDLDTLLGRGMTVEVDGSEGRRRIHGVVAEAAYCGLMEEQARYDVVLVPWLWFLGQRTDCRIFQRVNAIEIVRRVVAWHSGELQEKLTSHYREREYCVQYRESDLDFVCRLLEEEGVFFFFEHADGRHVMVLVDDVASCPNRQGYGTIPFYPPQDHARRERDHLHAWEFAARARTARTALRSFDFLQPLRPLESADRMERRHERDELEAYDYAGSFTSIEAGDGLARVRLEELRADRRRVVAAGNAAGLACGHRFVLRNFPRQDQNVEHLIVALETTIEVEPQRASDAGGAEPYSCVLEAAPTREPFRPPRLTPRPVVRGPQTAIVTGPAGEEIYTDEHGRVKVQFHWDREGRSDADSSCWLRVSQAWAGAGFGAMHVPRIGQEVIVDFLEGDPDRPIITGRVYNGARRPPFDLPGNATQSGIRSNSSKGGGGSNELRFEDRKGQEEVFLHAQKDERIVVENDKSESVGHDEALSVGHDRTRLVGANETVTVGANQSVTVQANRTDLVMLNEARTVGIAQQVSVGAARNVTVGAAQAHEVGLSDTWTVGGSRNAAIGRNDGLTVGGSREASVAGTDSLKVGKAQSVQVGGAQTVAVQESQVVEVGKTITLVAGDEITLKTGSAMVILKKNGDITIKGKAILIDGSGRVDVKAGGNITMKGQKVLQN